MTTLHSPSRPSVAFDDDHAVANAGLALVGALSEKLGLEELCEEMIDVAPFPGRRVATLVHAMVAGAACIDGADVLRSGATSSVLARRVMAPSTLGTFLRRFSFGHVRQLDRVSEMLMTRAWSLGAGPGMSPMTIDIDSTICEVYGNQKQGANYGYTKVLGYHPLLATRAETGETLHVRFRKGSANTQRGAQRFVREVAGRVRRAGASGPLTYGGTTPPDSGSDGSACPHGRWSPLCAFLFLLHHPRPVGDDFALTSAFPDHEHASILLGNKGRHERGITRTGFEPPKSGRRAADTWCSGSCRPGPPAHARPIACRGARRATR